MSLGLVVGSKSGSMGILVKDLPREGESGDDWGVGLGPIMKQVSRLELRPSFLDVTVNRGSGLMVGLVPRSIYRIIHI